MDSKSASAFYSTHLRNFDGSPLKPAFGLSGEEPKSDRRRHLCLRILWSVLILALDCVLRRLRRARLGLLLVGVIFSDACALVAPQRGVRIGDHERIVGWAVCK